MTFTREDLSTTFSDIAQSFEKNQKDVQDMANESVAAMAQFVALITSDTNSKTKQLSPLATFFQSTQESMKSKLASWEKSVQSYDKNIAFREKHGDSLLVYIYGQVKSAKSSLGNFILYGHHDPSDEQVAIRRDVKAFFESDSGIQNATKEAFEKMKKFKVDFVEATSAIQGLQIPGLTWVDSPGIHSSTEENGNLAMQYLDSADYVIFASNGKSPCKRSEVAEIKKIYDKNKPFLIVITRCDEPDVDEDEDGNITSKLKMHDEKDLSSIKEYCVDGIHDHCGIDKKFLHKNIICTSVLYAEENQTDAAWKESGLEEFVAQIDSVARQDGVQLKQRAPLYSLKEYNKKVLSSQESLKNDLKSLKTEIQTFRQSTSTAIEREKNAFLLELKYVIHDLVQQHVGDDRTYIKAVESSVKELFAQSSRNISQEIVQASENFAGNFFGNAALPDIALPRFENIYQPIEYKSSGKKRGGSLFGAILGGAIGFVAAGPAGAAVGVGLGGAAGGMAGGVMDGTKAGKTRVGDNRQSVELATVEKISAMAESAFKGQAKALDAECVQPIEGWVIRIEHAFNEVSDVLHKQNTVIEEVLSHE